MGKTIDITGNKYNHLTVLRKTSQKKGTNYLWECICDCPNNTITLATSADLKSGHKKSCGCIHAEQRSNLGKSKAKDLTNQVFGDLLALNPTNKRSDGRVVWKCRCLACGKELEVKSSALTKGEKTHCGCKAIASKGEEKIIDLLNQYQIPYEREKTFQDLKYNGKYLRYDFFIAGLYLLEYDGKQHFIKDTGYGRDLENIQYRDNLKNNYAKRNKIPLLRINYKDYENFDIQDIIPEQFKLQILEGKERIK